MTLAITFGLILCLAAPVCVPVAWIQLADRRERRHRQTHFRTGGTRSRSRGRSFAINTATSEPCG
jgi:hypothetical protein